jgi:hypothetical protein
LSSRGSSKTCKGAFGVSISFANALLLPFVCLLAERAEILYSVCLAEVKKPSGAHLIQSCGSPFKGLSMRYQNQPQKWRAKRALATDFCG